MQKKMEHFYLSLAQTKQKITDQLAVNHQATNQSILKSASIQIPGGRDEDEDCMYQCVTKNT